MELKGGSPSYNATFGYVPKSFEIGLDSGKAECTTYNDSGIEGVLAEGIEMLISADNYGGHTSVLVKSVLQFAQGHDSESAGWLEFGSVRLVRVSRVVICGSPCRARLDIVHSKNNSRIDWSESDVKRYPNKTVVVKMKLAHLYLLCCLRGLLTKIHVSNDPKKNRSKKSRF